MVPGMARHGRGSPAPVGRMYTGSVVRPRLFAFVLALLIAVTPVLGIVCQMDCEQPPKAVACHESEKSSDGPTLQTLHHPCGHDHTGGSPALMAGAAGVRELVGVAFVSVSIAALLHVAAADDRVSVAADMHGPPDPSGRRVSSRTTVLRI